jgi:hypothetical protein
MLRRVALALALFCAALAPAQAAEADRSPDDQVTMPPASAPPPAEQSPARRPPIDPVEARIKYLHERLRITAAQEPLWSDVARVMRENAKAVAPLVRERVQSAERGSAIDNIGSYEKLGEAQVDALKRFLAAFQTLYDKLSRDQKKIADSLFRIGPLSMIGGIPHLPEAMIAPAPETPYLAGPAYVPYPVEPAFPGVAPVWAYPVAPFHPPAFYAPPSVAYPFYANRPWLWGPPVGILGAPIGVFLSGRAALQPHGAGMGHH